MNQKFNVIKKFLAALPFGHSFNKPKRNVVAFCFLLFGIIANAQNPNCFRVTFTDKDNSPYSIDRPEEFLSPRAIAKRARFNIPVTTQDLPVSPQYIIEVMSWINCPTDIIAISKWNNSVVVRYCEVDDWQNIMNTINDFPFVDTVLPVANYPSPTQNMKTPIQEQHSKSMLNANCEYDYGGSIDNIEMHKGHLLHQADFCGEDMLICVFDVGWNNFDVLNYFQPLFNNGQIWGTRDLIPGMNNVYTGHGHGTLCTSEMAAAVDGAIVGTAPKANYFFIRSDDPVLEQLVEEDFYAYAAEIADSLGADVISVSLGYTVFDHDWQNIYTPADNNGTTSIASRAAAILAEKGVIVVNAAGNEGSSSWNYISRPGDAFNILAVGAVDKNGDIADYSGYGPTIDGRVKPDVAAPGHNAWGIFDDGFIGPYGSGTSCATPIIAGLSACLWQALPHKSSLQLMQLIREYSDIFNNPDNRTGFGIPNFYQLFLDHTLSVPETKVSKFSVYPNPTSGKLRITNYELQGRSVEVYDMMGKKISSHPFILSSSHQIDISHLNSEIYFLKIIADNSFEVIKVIKQ